MNAFEKHGIFRDDNKKSVILGTDWGGDCDDCVAVRILCRAHKEGIIDLKGINIDACMEKSVPSLHKFVLNEGVESLPIGIDLEATDFGGHENVNEEWYQYEILKGSDREYMSNEEAMDGVKLYRKILSEADGKVDIAEVGFMQVLADLLKSTPDEYSDKNGLELVRDKVDTFWAMAGKWDQENGKEYNLSGSKRAISGGKYVLENWPTKIVFLGFECGESVITGGKSVLDENDLLQRAMTAYKCENGRCSWDPMTVVLMIADIEKAGYEAVRGTASLDENGLNNFKEETNGKHYYVRKLNEDKWYENFINDLIV